jgi:hypothetical protein
MKECNSHTAHTPAQLIPCRRQADLELSGHPLATMNAFAASPRRSSLEPTGTSN